MKAPGSDNNQEITTSRQISEEHFGRITGYLQKKYGLRIPAEKKVMLESRFLKRLHALNMNSFSSYLEYVFKEGKTDEYLNFIDLVTTHKTSFFREDYQFNFINKILPQYCPKAVGNHRLNVWSAGCSTGEEVYTLGMVLHEFKKQQSNFDYKITGTDISRPSLLKAATGIYSMEELQGLPNDLIKKYFNLQDDGKAVSFSNSEVKARIRLGMLNLNNPAYKLEGTFDFIFCRNVIIYFDFETQRKVLEKLVSKLRPGGYLFLGHSETAIGTTLPIRSIQPTIYQKLNL
ncbi:methyltransferase domain-containing protein [Fulvivirga kasyanovii]|uniref:protein-glutamate O-methyltransferase n=1 Tax=Fulvivirga kasyanovii TaxID=396812 RepID=A0ABW9RSB7_9BACT|nr:CheR family methyltransferase [Fulvivirga kasyanovii]MTI25890.1 methyltransferase domain-containing protein [Fulvivirga kasyanovii]